MHLLFSLVTSNLILGLIKVEIVGDCVLYLVRLKKQLVIKRKMKYSKTRCQHSYG